MTHFQWGEFARLTLETIGAFSVGSNIGRLVSYLINWYRTLKQISKDDQ